VPAILNCYFTVISAGTFLVAILQLSAEFASAFLTNYFNGSPVRKNRATP